MRGLSPQVRMRRRFALVPIECDDDMIGHRQFQTGFKFSADDLPVRLWEDVVGDLLPFIQAVQTGPFDRADMDEHIGAAGVGLIKPNPFVALNHFTVPVAFLENIRNMLDAAVEDRASGDEVATGDGGVRAQMRFERFRPALSAEGAVNTSPSRTQIVPVWASLRSTAVSISVSSTAWHEISGGPQTYGILLGAIGIGAVGGSLGLRWLKDELGPDHLVATGYLGPDSRSFCSGSRTSPSRRFAPASSVVRHGPWC